MVHKNKLSYTVETIEHLNKARDALNNTDQWYLIFSLDELIIKVKQYQSKLLLNGLSDAINAAMKGEQYKPHDT